MPVDVAQQFNALISARRSPVFWRGEGIVCVSRRRRSGVGAQVVVQAVDISSTYDGQSCRRVGGRGEQVGYLDVEPAEAAVSSVSATEVLRAYMSKSRVSAARGCGSSAAQAAAACVRTRSWNW